jgi:methylmalonyl-CoA mutase
VQTSGRSLHAQEMDFNDIRTTLQALIAIYDNANSPAHQRLRRGRHHPDEESVRRALAIQLIINREWGLAMNENPLQGSFIIDELTDLVEAAVLAEFDRISERGGVLGAMETGYQRGRIQDESMLYEHRKHDGSLPIIGVNTFRNPTPTRHRSEIELARASEAEKESQLARVRRSGRHRVEAEERWRGSRRPRSSGRTSSPCSWMPPGVLAAAGDRGVLRGRGQYRRNVPTCPLG